MTMYQDVNNALISNKIKAEKERFTASFCFNKNLDVFKGHFPDMPILPGVMQLEMVRCTLEKNTGSAYRIKKIRKAKFSGQIRPEELINVAVVLQQTDEDDLHAKAVLEVNNKPAGKVSMVLEHSSA